MKIDKLYDEECNLIQKQKEIINEMNTCATKTFNVKRFKDLAEEYNKVVNKIYNINKQIDTMKKVNVESMLLSLKQHYVVK
jgi:uncharacterized protein YydD (DUF2326 family)